MYAISYTVVLPFYVCTLHLCSKEKGEESLAQRAIEAGAKQMDTIIDSSPTPVADHSYDPFPVTSNEWSGRDPFAENIETSERLSPDHLEPDSTTKSPSPPLAAKSPQPYKAPKAYIQVNVHMK